MEYFILSFLFLSLCLIFSLVLRMLFNVRNILFIFCCAVCASSLFSSNNMLTLTEEKVIDLYVNNFKISYFNPLCIVNSKSLDFNPFYIDDFKNFHFNPFYINDFKFNF